MHKLYPRNLDFEVSANYLLLIIICDLTASVPRDITSVLEPVIFMLNFEVIIPIYEP